MERFSLGRKPAAEDVVLTERITSLTVSAETQTTVSKKLYDRVKPDAIDKLERTALLQMVEKAVSDIADEDKLHLSADQQKALAALLADDMKGIGPLQRLLEESDITDIMVNGPDRVFVERRGRLAHTDIKFRDDDHVRGIAQRIARGIGRRVDDANPICDARLPDGSRVCIVIPPIAIDGTMISIRKFPNQSIGLDELTTLHSITPDMRDFLQLAAKCKLNIIVSGGTSSGKTTILNSLSQHIALHESTITIEDSAELRLLQPNVRRLETRPSLSDGMKEVTQRDLVKAALRMRPDRIILGEIRGPEALDLLSAFNTGHDGSMSTLHANSARDALARLETMVLTAVDLPIKAIRQQVASAVDLVIQAERMPDGVRRITEIAEITGIEGEIISMQQLFVFEVEKIQAGGAIIGRHKTMPTSLASAEKFRRHGLLEVARNIFAKG